MPTLEAEFAMGKIVLLSLILHPRHLKIKLTELDWVNQVLNYDSADHRHMDIKAYICFFVIIQWYREASVICFYLLLDSDVEVLTLIICWDKWDVDYKWKYSAVKKYLPPFWFPFFSFCMFFILTALISNCCCHHNDVDPGKNCHWPITLSEHVVSISPESG